MKKTNRTGRKDMVLGPGQAYKTNPNISLRREGEQGILFHADTGASEIINSTGMSILRLCNGRNTAEDIERKICSSYQGNGGTIQREVALFLQVMLKAGLIIQVK